MWAYMRGSQVAQPRRLDCWILRATHTAHASRWAALELLEVEQVKLFAKHNEMREERIYMSLATEMEELGEVCMVYVSENTQHLAVHLFRGSWEHGGEFAAWLRREDSFIL